MLASPKAALTTQLLFLTHDASHVSSSPMAALGRYGFQSS